MFRTLLEPEGATEKLTVLIEQALPVFQAAGDHAALYIGYSALGQVGNMRGQMDAGLEAYEQAATHAQQAGMQHEELGWRSTMRFSSEARFQTSSTPLSSSPLPSVRIKPPTSRLPVAICAPPSSWTA